MWCIPLPVCHLWANVFWQCQVEAVGKHWGLRASIPRNSWEQICFEFLELHWSINKILFCRHSGSKDVFPSCPIMFGGCFFWEIAIPIVNMWPLLYLCCWNKTNWVTFQGAMGSNLTIPALSFSFSHTPSSPVTSPCPHAHTAKKPFPFPQLPLQGPSGL